MIDGLYKATLDRFWNRLARGLVILGFSANGVTWTGLALATLVSALYLIHPNPLLYGCALLLVVTFDALDGAVARITNTCTRYGGYLDAVVDRYQEMIFLLAIGLVHGYWPELFLLITGSLLTSYHKARTAIEQPINNNAWPDLLERMERMILLGVGLILSQWIETPLLSLGWTRPFLADYLLVLAILTHLTAIQRFLRARRLLLKGASD
ncbi:MAG: CDP-alcohol phosphatidyltransferase family protein [Magnetococcales bacterium]|nr:CDP-alcohol phosphatidyltransferase family protein [Magnetococcales bacterium]